MELLVSFGGGEIRPPVVGGHKIRLWWWLLVVGGHEIRASIYDHSVQLFFASDYV